MFQQALPNSLTKNSAVGFLARRILGGQDDEIFFPPVEGDMYSVPERDLHNLNSTANAASVHFATDLASDRKTLAGITSLIVVVERLNPAAHALGLMEEGIRNTAEFKLSLAGIHVMPLLPITARYINVHVFQNAATVISKLQQGVKLECDPTISTLAAPWPDSVLTSNPNRPAIGSVLRQYGSKHRAGYHRSRDISRRSTHWPVACTSGSKLP
jgi:hypothetical protein